MKIKRLEMETSVPSNIESEVRMEHKREQRRNISLISAALALTVALTMTLTMLTTIISCGEVTTPKPRGYFRITLPEHDYTVYDGGEYTFEHSTMSQINHEKGRDAQEGWINVTYPALNCKIHVTYMHLGIKEEEYAYEDSHDFAYKHTIKADAIGESYYDDGERRVHAVLFDIKGNAATPAQFAITDSLGRFFRGSLYFNCQPNKDSLAPVVTYLRDDISHMIETFNWKNNSKKQ